MHSRALVGAFSQVSGQAVDADAPLLACYAAVPRGDAGPALCLLLGQHLVCELDFSGVTGAHVSVLEGHKDQLLFGFGDGTVVVLELEHAPQAQADHKAQRQAKGAGKHGTQAARKQNFLVSASADQAHASAPVSPISATAFVLGSRTSRVKPFDLRGGKDAWNPGSELECVVRFGRDERRLALKRQ